MSWSVQCKKNKHVLGKNKTKVDVYIIKDKIMIEENKKNFMK